PGAQLDRAEAGRHVQREEREHDPAAESDQQRKRNKKGDSEHPEIVLVTNRCRSIPDSAGRGKGSVSMGTIMATSFTGQKKHSALEMPTPVGRFDRRPGSTRDCIAPHISGGNPFCRCGGMPCCATSTSG